MTIAVAASPTMQRATALVADRRPGAAALGRDLAELVEQPDEFAAALRAGLEGLADPESLEGQRRVAPGIGATLGVRWPLIEAVERGFRAATRRDPTAAWLFVVDRLLREPVLEPRWFAFGLLERLVVDDPERTWQLLRRASRDAADWITVDSLAHPVATGVLHEDYRWAELELLVYSPSRWERRLVGSTIATGPHVDRRRGRTPDYVARSLPLIEQLIGDAEPDVQKALSWALRTLARIDPAATTAFLAAETERAVAGVDGHRAWVIRDSLSKLDPSEADRLRSRLAGIRRRAGSPSTSPAGAIVASLGGGALGSPMPEPPLT